MPQRVRRHHDSLPLDFDEPEARNGLLSLCHLQKVERQGEVVTRTPHDTVNFAPPPAGVAIVRANASLDVTRDGSEAGDPTVSEDAVSDTVQGQSGAGHAPAGNVKYQ